MRRPLLLLILSTLLAATSSSADEPRAVAMILDTSGSMGSADAPRYTVQITQIISDLLADDDRLTVVRMPQTDRELMPCRGGVNASLTTELDTRRRHRFKQRLDDEISYGGGTLFASPVRTAIDALERDSGSRRMLLIVADSGGLGSCERPLTRELSDLHRQGALIAAVNLGSTAGAFDGNPAFDFTLPALDAHGLLDSVGHIYQRFLGVKEVQSGRARGDVTVVISPQVRRAFLVVAADGVVGPLRSLAGNPRADALDLDYRTGDTTGLDRLRREYRIVRLVRPRAGTWRFGAHDLRSPAAWLLIQEPIPLALRLRDPGRVAAGQVVLLEADVVDAETGRRITDLSGMDGLTAEVEIDGRRVTLRDDGSGGDRKAGDGVLSARLESLEPGQHRVDMQLETDFLEASASTFELDVAEATWGMGIATPERAESGRPVALEVTLQEEGNARRLPEVRRVEADTDTGTVELKDDGNPPDARADDQRFAAHWTPQRPGDLTITYRAYGGHPEEELARAEAPLTVRGRIRLGRPPAIDLGRVGSGDVATGLLDLSSADVEGDFELRVSSALDLDRSVLELEADGDWQPVGGRPLTLRLVTGGTRSWPLRLRVGACPEGSPPGALQHLTVETTAADGSPLRAEVPLVVQVEEDPWLKCWWPVLALLTASAGVGVVIHGIVSPSRFGGRLGVALSEEENEEGCFYPLRQFRAARSGFYRDASIHVRPDYRLSGRAAGAVARLRADGSRVRIRPASGAAVWRRSVDGNWEELPPEETTVRYGTVYRNDDRTLFFEIRNG